MKKAALEAGAWDTEGGGEVLRQGFDIDENIGEGEGVEGNGTGVEGKDTGVEGKDTGVEAGRRCRDAQAHRGDKGKWVSRTEEMA